MRRARIGLGALLGLVAACILALFLSALLDRPSHTIESRVTIQASPQTVWKVLTDFAEYSRWNPYIVKARGEPREGSSLALQLDRAEGDVQSVEPEVSIVKQGRKIRWQSRTLVPGIDDREYEAIIEPTGEGQVRFVQRTRFEGLLVPFLDVGPDQDGLDRMGAALKEQAEKKEGGPETIVPDQGNGTLIRVTGTWECDKPLEQYGDLPIIVDSRIDNAAAQPESVDGVWLTGPRCSGDGNPNTVDLVLHIHGNGGDIGPTSDAVKLRQGPHDIDITGEGNCGRPSPGAHQDGVQVMLGYRITFSDFRVGDLAHGRATCDGAGGGFFIQQRFATDPKPEDVLCIRCHMITDNHGLFIGDSVRSGAKSSTFVADHAIFVEPAAVKPIDERNKTTVGDR
jgi:hypothetical protein